MGPRKEKEPAMEVNGDTGRPRHNYLESAIVDVWADLRHGKWLIEKDYFPAVRRLYDTYHEQFRAAFTRYKHGGEDMNKKFDDFWESELKTGLYLSSLYLAYYQHNHFVGLSLSVDYIIKLHSEWGLTMRLATKKMQETRTLISKWMRYAKKEAKLGYSPEFYAKVTLIVDMHGRVMKGFNAEMEEINGEIEKLNEKRRAIENEKRRYEEPYNKALSPIIIDDGRYEAWLHEFAQLTTAEQQRYDFDVDQYITNRKLNFHETAYKALSEIPNIDDTLNSIIKLYREDVLLKRFKDFKVWIDNKSKRPFLDYSGRLDKKLVEDYALRPTGESDTEEPAPVEARQDVLICT